MTREQRHTTSETGQRRPAPALAATLMVAAVLMLPRLAVAADDAQAAYGSPQQAVEALTAAVGADDAAAQLLHVLGADAAQLVSSGDPVADNRGRERFLAAMAKANRVEMDGADRAVLIIGEKAWPFPIPIVRGAGGWRFDTAAGAEEILDRRIGRNELNAIEVCRATVDAQLEYASVDHDGDGILEYASRFRSTPGSRDGLYWPAYPGEPPSPMGPLMASAQSAGYWLDETQGIRDEPYHGYYYRILLRQGPGAPGGAYEYVAKERMIGGFALVAYPAKYGASGVMTFITSHDGVVYQKDLGAETAELAAAMAEFNPDQSWTAVADSPSP